MEPARRGCLAAAPRLSRSGLEPPAPLWFSGRVPRGRSERIEQALDALAALRQGPLEGAAIRSLRDGLRSRYGVVAAKAAWVAGAMEAPGLAPEMVAAFERFLTDPVRSDPGCLAKQAIAAALDGLDHPDPEPFLRGIRHRQPEPVWGGTRDTAGDLRVSSAFALVRLGWHGLASELAELLADPEAPVRAGAARAAAASRDVHLAAVLRLKILLPDPEPQVTGECVGALLTLDPAQAVPFVDRLLAAGDEAAREAAAIALGESRLRAAFPVLHRWWETTAAPGLRRTALLALAMLRHEEAIAFLLGVVRDGAGPDARDALAALRIHRYDGSLRERIRAAGRRRDVDLRAALEPFEGDDEQT